MLDEFIRSDALIRLYSSKQNVGDYGDDEKLQLCHGKIKHLVSDSELEIITEDDMEEKLQKNICYIMYIFSTHEVFMCSCYYKSAYNEEKGQIILFEIVSPLERVQRRRHQRVSCHSRIMYQQITKEEVIQYKENACIFSDVEEQQNSFENSLVDISGGGIRFTSKNPLPIDSFLFVRFEIINEKRAVEMKVIGQVVYSSLLRNEQDCYDIRMKYIGLTEEERKQIIHFVFQLERDSISIRWQRGGEFA